ncbi:hypothetical protein NPL7_01235 [Metamycoplasma hyosynoviae]|uniref:Uncharacterized protein n=2 Tax=Metamycoplasma hyosynoviae TaxID=29559 RepID=A0A063YAX7_9BACT|nr:hypothetical protein [Metamycoplasma hyosynoviae]ASI53710.1 hypothetical protein MHSN_00550 [Metamycoplasma hyosynoviae]KDE42379.1 hypothetical protein NPL7_01235 [Metamycoplasma hyosynoviae]KDE42450.1 hypothetical protein NPL3_01460 [Metamycoplasma hyosynoviae]KDE42884.1 hypothetical protein NPL5_03425 [Metamycoplasma hyosynoviae]KDE43480.1 hypothetical protein NPL1_00600 [Metamycoplasma hyosynoviae]
MAYSSIQPIPPCLIIIKNVSHRIARNAPFKAPKHKPNNMNTKYVSEIRYDFRNKYVSIKFAIMKIATNIPYNVISNIVNLYAFVFIFRVNLYKKLNLITNFSKILIV